MKTKSELLEKIAEWDENWDGEDDEMEINAAVRNWVLQNDEETVAAFLNHAQVKMYGPPNRMSIVKRLSIMKAI